MLLGCLQHYFQTLHFRLNILLLAIYRILPGVTCIYVTSSHALLALRVNLPTSAIASNDNGSFMGRWPYILRSI